MERTDPDAGCESALVEAFLGLRAAIAAGQLDPARIHTLVTPHAISLQMQRMFAIHRALQKPAGAAASVGIGSPEPVNI